MIDALVRLTKLANKLDHLGMFEHADQIDLIVLAAGERSRAVDDFIIALKKAFENVAKNPTVLPTINEQSLSEIIQVIDILAEHGNFTGPRLSEETFTQAGDEVYGAVEGLLELEESIKKLTNAIQVEKDSVKKQDLERELSIDVTALNKLHEKINLWKNGKRAADATLYKKFEELLAKRRAAPGV